MFAYICCFNSLTVLSAKLNSKKTICIQEITIATSGLFSFCFCFCFNIPTPTDLNSISEFNGVNTYQMTHLPVKATCLFILVKSPGYQDNNFKSVNVIIIIITKNLVILKYFGTLPRSPYCGYVFEEIDWLL